MRGDTNEREGPTGGLPRHWSTEIGPVSVRSWPPPSFPDPTNQGMANAEEGAISDLPPPKRGKKRKRVREGPFRTALDDDGGGHRHTVGQGGERAGLPSLAAHPAASAGVPMPRGFLRKGTL